MIYKVISGHFSCFLNSNAIFFFRIFLIFSHYYFKISAKVSKKIGGKTKELKNLLAAILFYWIFLLYPNPEKESNDIFLHAPNPFKNRRQHESRAKFTSALDYIRLTVVGIFRNFCFDLGNQNKFSVKINCTIF